MHLVEYLLVTGWLWFNQKSPNMQQNNQTINQERKKRGERRGEERRGEKMTVNLREAHENSFWPARSEKQVDVLVLRLIVFV